MIDAQKAVEAHIEYLSKVEQEQPKDNGVGTQERSGAYPLQGNNQIYPLKGKL